MRKLSLIIICNILIVTNVAASGIGDSLGKSDVSRLELLANNLNMLFLVSKIQEGKDGIKKDGDTENTITKYSVSKDHKLIIEDFYTAPVAKVSNTECNEKLSKLSEQVSGNDSSISKVLSMISPTELSISQAQQITKEAYLVVYMQAKENMQLSINCKR